MAVSSSVFEYLNGIRWRAISEKYSLASLAVEVPKPDMPSKQVLRWYAQITHNNFETKIVLKNSHKYLKLQHSAL